jgi:hypothetical protein
MTGKQYIGLLLLSGANASPFVANQWLKFTKSQHEYQKQLSTEKLSKENAEAQKRQNDADAHSITVEELKQYWVNSKVYKQWESFAQDVQHIKWLSFIPAEKCDQLAAIIRRKDFDRFNAFLESLPQSERGFLRFPDLSDPNLTEQDVEDLSHLSTRTLRNQQSNLGMEATLKTCRRRPRTQNAPLLVLATSLFGECPQRQKSFRG